MICKVSSDVLGLELDFVGQGVCLEFLQCVVIVVEGGRGFARPLGGACWSMSELQQKIRDTFQVDSCLMLTFLTTSPSSSFTISGVLELCAW